MNAKFLQMLPALLAAIRHGFRGEPKEIREDHEAEALANCYVAFVRLMDKGKTPYPSPIARYAIRQVRAGRRVGTKQNVRDIMRRGRRESSDLLGQLTETKTVGPADTAAARMDYSSWLRTLPAHKRKVAVMLAKGEQTSAAAKRFHCSPGRISQIRRELETSWKQYQGAE